METILESLMKERDIRRLSGADAGKLTKECLQTALIYLMGKKDFEKITVTEIVSKSGVSRSSFYRNYSGKEDLLIEISQNLSAIISDAIKDERYQNNPYLWYEDLFRLMKDNQETVKLLYQANLKQKNIYKFIPPFYEIFSPLDIKERYLITAYENGLNAILIEWFRRGMQEDLSYMASLCQSLYGNLHKKLITKLS